jgi:uncharacterized delta-60 repeat protein
MTLTRVVSLALLAALVPACGGGSSGGGGTSGGGSSGTPGVAAGRLDPTFTPNTGRRLLDGSAGRKGKAVAVQSDGMSVVAGTVGTSIVVARFNLDGWLDTAFGTGGLVTTTVPLGAASGEAIAIQADQKIVVAGNVWNGADQDIVVVRYNSDGTLDTTFDTDGILTTTFGAGYDAAAAVLVEPASQKIVVAGTATTGLLRDFAAARLTTAGAPDATFGSGGIATVNVGIFTSTQDAGTCAAFDSLGRLYVGGTFDDGWLAGFGIARFLASGVLDTGIFGFAFFGRASIPIGSGNAAAHAIAVQGDNKPVLVGESHNGSDYDVTLARFTTAGGLDSGTFGTVGTGIVTTDVGEADESAHGVLYDPNGSGSIVVAAETLVEGIPSTTLLRYTLAGALDTSGFGEGDGMVHLDLGDSASHPRGIAFQTLNSQYVVAGYSRRGGDTEIALARVSQGGYVDSPHLCSGIVTTSVGTSGSYTSTVAVQSDGKIIAAGYAYTGTDHALALVRYLDDGTLDPAFDGDGKVLTGFPGSSGYYPSRALIQADGKIVVVGTLYLPGNSQLHLARYHPDGTLDAGFGSGGLFGLDLDPGYEYGYGLAFQADGKIVASGYIYTPASAFAVRLNPDGSLDPGFGSAGVYIHPSSSYAFSIAAQADGKVVLGGYQPAGTLLLRLNSAGVLDPTFDGDGVATPVLFGGGEYFYDVAVQSDGKIVAAGQSGSSAILFRCTTTGAPDPGFDGDGKVQTPLGYSSSYAFSLLIQSDGMILLAGPYYSTQGAGLGIARYTSTGSPDTGFGVDGLLQIPGPNSVLVGMGLDSNGRIAVGGYHDNGSSPVMLAARIE